MPSRVTRRRLLSASAAAGSAALAGCSGPCRRDIPFLGPGMPNDGEIATEPADTVPEQATVVEFSELPDAERSLLRTAVEAGVARACMADGGDRAGTFRSFAGRMGESNYLAYRNDHYALWVRIEDVVYSGTAPPSEGDANPCC